MVEQKHVVLGVTGSIAAYKAADIIRHLVMKRFKVSVAMTREAECFISPLTLSTLAGVKVCREMFGQEDHSWQMPHITLAQDADVFLIAPATAAIIGKIAHGIADNLLTCIALATKAPVLIAPAMNAQMYHHPIVQENCLKLEKQGIQLIKPVKGKLACGIIGEGHIAEVETIVAAVARARISAA